MTRARRERYVEEHYADWFDFSLADAVLGSSEQSVRRSDFNGFAPNFVYRYRRAQDVTVLQLADLAQATARRALTFQAR